MIYKDFDNKEVLDQFTLEAGDLLYIPIGMYHKVETVGPRILLSIHFKNKKNQALDNFKITSNKENNRRKWYNWLPEFEKKIKRAPQRLMNKDSNVLNMNIDINGTVFLLSLAR